MSNNKNTVQRCNLLSQFQGAKIVFATDEWFASASNLIHDSDPVFIPDLYSEQGKVMDGWESRRKRSPGHDWCLISLAWKDSLFEKQIDKLEVDTAYFTGNHVPRISVQIATVIKDTHKWENKFPRGGGGQGTCATPQEIEYAEALCQSISPDNCHWVELLPMTPLNPGYEESRYHSFDIPTHISKQIQHATHIRINYYPDGGVARMKLWANVVNLKHKASYNDNHNDNHQSNAIISITSNKDNFDFGTNLNLIDLACSTHGGRGVGCSNRHYGEPANLIQPHSGKDMGDGWETARHPNRPPVLKLLPGNSSLCDFSNLMDWSVLALGSPCQGGVKQIMIDTKHFKGNFPESVQVEACFYAPQSPTTLKKLKNKQEAEEAAFLCRPPGKDIDVGWFVILPRVKLTADAQHVFSLNQITHSDKPVTHVRVTIWPDGGLSRVRIYGNKNDEINSTRSFL